MRSTVPFLLSSPFHRVVLVTRGITNPLLVTRDHSLLDSTFDTNLTLLSPRVAAPHCVIVMGLHMYACSHMANFFPSHEITKKNELTYEVPVCHSDPALE